MTTLRRELIHKLSQALLGGHIAEWASKYTEEHGCEVETWAEAVREDLENLADAALELRGFQFQPKTIEQAIYAGVPVTEEMTERENLRQTAPRMFEKALQFSKPLPWWNGKDWTAFGEWVCAEYEKDKTSFGRYNIWRNAKYNKGGITNQRLRGFPAEFYDSWDMFKMSEPKKTDEARPNYDALAAATEREKNAVPRPVGLVPNIKRAS